MVLDELTYDHHWVDAVVGRIATSLITSSRARGTGDATVNDLRLCLLAGRGHSLRPWRRLRQSTLAVNWSRSRRTGVTRSRASATVEAIQLATAPHSGQLPDYSVPRNTVDRDVRAFVYEPTENHLGGPDNALGCEGKIR